MDSVMAFTRGRKWGDSFTFSRVSAPPGKKVICPLFPMRVLQSFLQKGNVNWVLDLDLKGCFDNISHQALQETIQRRVSDRSMIRPIGKWLKIGVVEADGKREKGKVYVVRYADDCVLSFEYEEDAHALKAVLETSLADYGRLRRTRQLRRTGQIQGKTAADMVQCTDET